MKIDYDVTERVYLPFRICEIVINGMGDVSYTIEATAPFMYYRQTGVSQKNLTIYGLSYGKEEENEKDI